MIGTLTWYFHKNLPPKYKEFYNIDDLMNYLTYLQNMLYNPDYILVEFQGTIYNASVFGTQSQRRDNIALYIAMHEYKRQQEFKI